MDAKPSDAQEPARGAQEEPPSSTEAKDTESFGVVDFTRLAKDDGRALIVFTRPPGR